MGKIAVTGGAGFIGSHTVDLLVKKGYDVVVVDDLSNGRRENINPAAKFYEVNICDPYLREVLGKEGPDAVIHMAAQISVKKSIENPRLDAHTNIIGSISLLESCKDLCIDKVVYSSSVGIYGEPAYLPVDEKHPVKPISPYGASKQAVEDYIYYYEKNHCITGISLRFGNIYGPRQDPAGEAGVISIFTDQLLRGEKPMINGDGGQTRDFVYVGDAAEACVLALEAETEKRTFNIGSGTEVSIEKLFHHLKDLTKSDLFPVHGDPVAGEIRNVSLKSELAWQELGWKPKTELKDGLKKTVDWVKSTKK